MIPHGHRFFDVMKKLCLSVCLFVVLALVARQPDVVHGQSLLSPFAYVCRRTCGGYGIFRRLCCSYDQLCCTKPSECPEDPTQDTMLPMCSSCNEDVDCMWTAKCCDHDGRKCCTPLRSSFFTKNTSQRAKEKIGAVNSANSTKSGQHKETEAEEEK